MHYPKETILNFIKDCFGDDFKEYNEWINIRSTKYFKLDKTHSFGINTKTNFIHDFKGTFVGTFENFAAQHLELSIEETRKFLLENYSIPSLFQVKEVKEVKEAKEVGNVLPNEFIPFGHKLGNYGKAGLKYLESRGIDLEYAIKKHLGYAIEGKYKNCIIIPFFENDEIVYFVARSWETRKILNPHNFPSDGIVYNIDEINREVFITEGIFDALTLKYQTGTCMLGATISKEKILKILSKPNLDKIIYIPDNDERGEQEFMPNLEKIKLFIPIDRKIKLLFYPLDKKFKDLNESKIDFINVTDCKEFNVLNILKRKI